MSPLMPGTEKVLHERMVVGEELHFKNHSPQKTSPASFNAQLTAGPSGLLAASPSSQSPGLPKHRRLRATETVQPFGKNQWHCQ